MYYLTNDRSVNPKISFTDYTFVETNSQRPPTLRSGILRQIEPGPVCAKVHTQNKEMMKHTYVTLLC